jgi:hypothetical protein
LKLISKLPLRISKPSKRTSTSWIRTSTVPLLPGRRLLMRTRSSREILKSTKINLRELGRTLTRKKRSQRCLLSKPNICSTSNKSSLVNLSRRVLKIKLWKPKKRSLIKISLLINCRSTSSKKKRTNGLKKSSSCLPLERKWLEPLLKLWLSREKPEKSLRSRSS